MLETREGHVLSKVRWQAVSHTRACSAETLIAETVDVRPWNEACPGGGWTYSAYTWYFYRVLNYCVIYVHGLTYCISAWCLLEVKREYYQNCFIYCHRATSSMGTVNKNSSHSPVGPWVCLCVFGVAWFVFKLVYVLFYLGHVSHFPFMFWRWRNKLKWAPFELFAPSPLLRVRSWRHPF